jgi:hypothetical protein
MRLKEARGLRRTLRGRKGFVFDYTSETDLGPAISDVRVNSQGGLKAQVADAAIKEGLHKSRFPTPDNPTRRTRLAG